MGDASADECDDNPSAGVPFRVGRPFTDAFTDFVPTDGEGLVTFGFDGLPLDGTLRVIEQIPAGIGHFVAYCVDESGGELGVAYPDYAESSPGIGVADVAVGTADNVLCDWYNVPRATASSDGSHAPQRRGTPLLDWSAVSERSAVVDHPQCERLRRCRLRTPVVRGARGELLSG